jgi:hypothetical protein
MSGFIQVQDNLFVQKSDVRSVRFNETNKGLNVSITLRSGDILLECDIGRTRKTHIIHELMRSD